MEPEKQEQLRKEYVDLEKRIRNFCGNYPVIIQRWSGEKISHKEFSSDLARNILSWKYKVKWSELNWIFEDVELKR